MGRMVLVKCNCGYCDERFRFGVNWSYREVKKHQTALAKSGRYGMEWKNLLASDPELLVDAELHLYQCPRCYQLFSEYRMDLYNPYMMTAFIMFLPKKRYYTTINTYALIAKS